MPWWVAIVTFLLGWAFKLVYDWKVHPAITKSQKKQEKKEAQKEEQTKLIRQQKLDALNQIWLLNRASLNVIRINLIEFGRLNDFPDSYPATRCNEMAAEIEMHAASLERPEFQTIKTKLINYGQKRNQTNQNTLLIELIRIYQKPINGKLEPIVLREEIERVLEETKSPPYSEKDLK